MNQQLNRIKAENVLLRKVVERHTIELKRRKHEIRIEAALERVRAVAMSMKVPSDMLEICRTISRELQALNVNDIRNVQTAIVVQERGVYINYEYYARHKKTFVTDVDYGHPLQAAFIRKMLKGPGEFFSRSLKGKELRRWYAHQKTTNQFADRFLKTAESLNYYWYSLGPIALGISTYSPLSEEEIGLFKRFRNVFELAYRRYLDIEQALAQAMEAKIEASLEKVRAQAMSMRTTQELRDVGEVIFKELKLLGFSDLRNTEILINNDTNKSIHSHYYSDYGVSGTIEVFYNDHPIVKKWANEMKKARDAFAEVIISEKEIKAWRKYREEIGYLPDPKLDGAKSVYYYSYSTGLGALSVSSFTPITEAQLNTLKRFRNVFGLAYRRYVDVAQAEAHARESRIELSLERVRARSMAMHKSDELVEAADVVFQQLKELGIQSIRTGIATFDVAKETVTVWSRAHADSKERILGVVPRESHPFFVGCFDAWKTKEKFYSMEFVGNEVVKYYRHMSSILSYPTSKTYNSKEVFYTFFFPEGSVNVITQEKLTDEELSIMQRFAGVFGVMYRRFLDLQKAEAQAREAQIEASLERVRAAAMSMNKPADLLNVCEVLFKEFRSLGFNELRNAMVNIHNDEEGSFLNYDYSDEIGGSINPLVYNIHPVIEKQIKQIRSADDAFSETVFAGDNLKEWKKFRRRIGERNDPRIKKSSALYYYFYSIGAGSIGISTFSPIDQQRLELLKRFRNVFTLSYQRYADIAMAEAQAKEVQIQLALERVRARTMAMQRSDELSEASFVLFNQLKELGEVAEQLSISIYDEDARVLELYSTIYGNQWNESGRIPFEQHDVHRRSYAAWKKHKKSIVIDLSGGALDDFNRFKMETSTQYKSAAELPKDRWVLHTAFFSKGSLTFSTHERRPQATIDLLERCAAVFDLTYTRFLDLKRAEAQAREAQIEAALERVRSKTMAMHNSHDVGQTVATMFDEWVKLGIRTFRCGIGILEDRKQMEVWTAKSGVDGRVELIVGQLDMSMHPLLQGAYNGWKNKEESFSYELKEDDIKKYFTAINNHPDYPVKYDISAMPSRIFHKDFYFNEGTLFVFSLEELAGETSRILKRFAAVLGQTYRRFLDLQKAEIQAREAQIEAALERVRSKAMAMHTSTDLATTVSAVFGELRKLGLETVRTGVALYSQDRPAPVFYASATTEKDDALAIVGSPDPSSHRCLALQYEAWSKQKNYFPVLNGEELKAYYNVLSLQPPIHKNGGDPFRHDEYGYYLPFSEGNFYAWSLKPFTEMEINILSRFKGIVDLTFRRYVELSRAEAQAHEAQIEASLERVRSRTLAMQKSDELAETAAVLFRQLITLGIEPNRLYIAIIKDDTGAVEFWITDEDGSKVSSAFTANLLANRSWKKMFDGWKDGETSLIIDMQGEELQEYFRHLNSLNVPFKGGLSQKRRVQNVAYFSKGFIGMASPHEQPEETSTLLERFAAVFNLTFTRFNDLKLAEAQAHQAYLDLIQLQAEKKRAEDALTELSTMQAQLVHQEKLASLGQLTAGIAHEIKNPLNFVSNFSSVSLEMVDEVLEEIKASAPELDKGETPQLLGHIKANLGKIIEHGARADSIVKSMLQHSRGGARRVESTDVNTLIRDFVNLAFHGMRASKSPINVNIELVLDKSTRSVPLIAEDFSRVILNLCQNAFDAMREKLNAEGGKSYLPKLSVRSRRDSNRVVIHIEDNGPGIPDAIRDKVLQPFFTTKKGTQGTGLGLSITNDIVKAHGGEIKIEMNNNGGATFIIGLPTETQR